jgi:hypothetical protein
LCIHICEHRPFKEPKFWVCQWDKHFVSNFKKINGPNAQNITSLGIINWEVYFVVKIKMVKKYISCEQLVAKYCCTAAWNMKHEPM